MSKYSSELKLKVVEYYLNNHGGYEATANYFNIPSFTAVKKWVKKYQEHGIKGLLKNQKKSYSGEFKQNVIEYIHKTHLSYQETAIHFNIAGAEVINKWERIYYEEGPQGLYIERRGRSKNMSSKPKKKNLNKKVEEDLIAENQRLRMENEYLKKLNALVQERIKRENKKK
jgi:transposase